MSYQLGLAVGSYNVPTRFAYNQGLAVGGAMIATPGFIKEETISLNTEVQQMALELGTERSSWGTVPDDQLDEKRRNMDIWWKSVWSPFYVEWSAFYSNHGATWGARNVYENFWGSTWDQVQDFRKRLINMRESAEQVGYFFHAPSPTSPKEGQGLLGSLGQALSDFLSKIVWVVLLVGGIIILVKLVPTGGYHAMGVA